MDAVSRIERALASAVDRADAPGAPRKLGEAIRYAVFPRGARIRARLCLAVAMSCGDDQPSLSDAAASAIELLHCASLVHDDLPCFDDAEIRRGKPSVHKAFGEPLAVLAGDALIVLAFQTLAKVANLAPARVGMLLGTVGDAVGVPLGIVAGQAWECEKAIELAAYQRAKTGALFAAATIAGATSAGVPGAESWREMGELIGEAYQVADDIRDVVSDPDQLGKPCGQDAAHGRPSAALQLGVDGAMAYLRDVTARACAAVPPCRGVAELRALIRLEAQRLLPRAESAAAA